jgi:hypothetical protein
MQADNLHLDSAERKTLEAIASSDPKELMTDAIARLYKAMDGNHPCEPWSITRELAQDLADMNDGMSQLVQDYFHEICGGDYGPDWSLNRDEWCYDLKMPLKVELLPDAHGNRVVYCDMWLTSYHYAPGEDYALELAKDTVDACKDLLARLDGANAKPNA